MMGASAPVLSWSLLVNLTACFQNENTATWTKGVRDWEKSHGLCVEFIRAVVDGGVDAEAFAINNVGGHTETPLAYLRN